MKKKKFSIGDIKLEMHPNGFPKGFVVKRELNLKECRHIMHNLLGIEIGTAEDLYADEYKEYNKELRIVVNKWLVGDADDNAIMEYAYDCSDESLGMFNIIPIIAYLIKREVI